MFSGHSSFLPQSRNMNVGVVVCECVSDPSRACSHPVTDGIGSSTKTLITNIKKVDGRR